MTAAAASTMAAGMASPVSMYPANPEDQKEMIAEAMKLEMKQGQVWYVLGSKWWQLWKAYVRFDEQSDPLPKPSATAAAASSLGAAGAADGAAEASRRSPSNSSSMDEVGVMVAKAEEDGMVVVTTSETAATAAAAAAAAAAGTSSESVAVKAETNEHRVAELSLEEGGGGEPAKVESEPPAPWSEGRAGGAGPGPIDNRELGEGRELREDMMEGVDYVLLHNRAYELLEAWYGGGPRFKRWVISLGSDSHTQLMVELFPVKFMVYTCLPNGKADKESLRVQLYSRAKTMRQVCADVKSSLNLTPQVDTRLSLRKLDEEEEGGGTAGGAFTSGEGEAAEAEGPEGDGWQAIHLEEVSQLLHEVMGDTQTVALLVETKDTSDPSVVTSFPRDHILLRWRRKLKVGDLIDARDSDKNWFEAGVTEVNAEGDPDKVKVHFLGWAEKWDEILDRSSEQLQKLHTFTTPWRQDLQVTSKCEVSSLRNQTKRWYEATVGGVKYEDGKRLLLVQVGVPRFNDMRRALNLNPIKKWSDLTKDPEYQAALQEVYGDDVELCDVLVGNLAEDKIEGFAISETSFHIFLVMASRRIESDRFFTKDFTPEVYSQEGYDRVTKTEGIRDLLARHLPDITNLIPKSQSAFKPWGV